MNGEHGDQRIGREYMAETVGDVLGAIHAQLIDGAYDVLRNGHVDEIVISDGTHEFRHELTRPEAEDLERAVWSAGEDQLVMRLAEQIVNGLRAADIKVRGDQLHLQVRLRELPSGS